MPESSIFVKMHSFGELIQSWVHFAIFSWPAQIKSAKNSKAPRRKIRGGGGQRIYHVINEQEGVQRGLRRVGALYNEKTPAAEGAGRNLYIALRIPADMVRNRIKKPLQVCMEFSPESIHPKCK